ncbi:methyltransferase [Nocardia puris]|uniref:methyltransferase n=1 Tax=Nocardia puris TaxID=208602 RepID=UPI001895A54D|nr:methyltransferase [Nocardia puris]MBF6214064.1 methyltransferase [Nocardia puris]MBF6368652.1 methyltransferase [Nocardia puris]MBF6461554.1 methyltransferase [Nocardia puris]
MIVEQGAREQLGVLLAGKWVVPVIGAVAELGIADLVADGPVEVAELAKSSGTHENSLHRLLRAAASIGVVSADGDTRYGPTALSECLRADVPGSLRAAAIMFAMDPFWSPYARIRHSVTTGEPAFDLHFGTTIYDYLRDHPEHARVFGSAAAAFHAEAIRSVPHAFDFSPYATVADIGGGTGALLGAVLGANPGVRGVLLELPEVAECAEKYLAAAGLEERVDIVPGDFFVGVPRADAYLIKSCLHNFPDDRVVEALRVIRSAIPDGAPLLVIETVIPPGDGRHYSKFDDIEMLVIAGGADRTRAQWSGLLAAAGFGLDQALPCGDRFSILLAMPR